MYDSIYKKVIHKLTYSDRSKSVVPWRLRAQGGEGEGGLNKEEQGNLRVRNMFTNLIVLMVSQMYICQNSSNVYILNI